MFRKSNKEAFQAVEEYNSEGRPGEATPVGIIFTDGYSQRDTSEAASQLRTIIPNMFAIAINHQVKVLKKSTF